MKLIYLILFSIFIDLAMFKKNEISSKFGDEDYDRHDKEIFNYVSNYSDMSSIITGARPGYVALRQDIYVPAGVTITNLASGSTICLNGHKLIFDNGNAAFNLRNRTLFTQKKCRKIRYYWC